MFHRLLPLLIALFMPFTAALGAKQPIAVIVHPDSGVSHITREEAVNIFMGRQKRLSSGLVALPIEQAKPEETRARFYKLLVNKAIAEINAYWARLYFTGQAQPPRQAQTPEEVLELVATNKGAIGFVEREKVDRRVREVLVLEGGP